MEATALRVFIKRLHVSLSCEMDVDLMAPRLIIAQFRLDYMYYTYFFILYLYFVFCIYSFTRPMLTAVTFVMSVSARGWMSYDDGDAQLEPPVASCALSERHF